MSDPGVWFDQLYTKHYKRLMQTAFYSLHDMSLAEDMVEEVFLTLLYKQHSLMKHPNIPGWLSLTLKNIIDDELKSAWRKYEVPLVFDEDAPVRDTYKHPLKDLLPEKLSHKEREILILLLEKQLSYNEISQKLGISEANCRIRAYRARVHCRELMEKEKKEKIF